MRGVETEKLATSVQAEQDAIRKGWRPAPKVSDTPRPVAEVEVATGDPVVGLREAHADVVDHGAEEGPVVVCAAQQLDVGGGEREDAGR